MADAPAYLFQQSAAYLLVQTPFESVPSHPPPPEHAPARARTLAGARARPPAGARAHRPTPRHRPEPKHVTPRRCPRTPTRGSARGRSTCPPRRSPHPRWSSLPRRPASKRILKGDFPMDDCRVKDGAVD